MTRYFVPVLLTVALLGACSPPAPVVLTGDAFGTTWSVRLTGLPGDTNPEGLQLQIVVALDSIDRVMSNWRSDSAIEQFNAAPAGQWIDVPAELAELVTLARTISLASDGAFDITVAPLVRAWGFGPAAQPAVPDPATLNAARARTGFGHLSVRMNPPALRKAKPGITTDLSAIAKGYAVDRIAAVLDKAGCRSYLVEIGGELRARGQHPDGRAWRAAVRRPEYGLSPEPLTVLPVTDTAVATSGDYLQQFESGGRRYSHIIDPRTGRPAGHNLASVTVLATSAAEADALATALLVLGPVDGPALARAQDLKALFVLRKPDGFEQQESPALAAWLAAQP